MIVNLADMHTGSTTALFPDQEWASAETGASHRLTTDDQRAIYKHFMDCAELVRLKSRGVWVRKNLIIINSGDAIDGNHHNTFELVTRILHEQADIHKTLMEDFMGRCGFNASAGDRLIYIRGTEVHTEHEEIKIASDLGAEIADHAGVIVDNLRLWFVHAGPTAGRGANKGNSLRNRLKDTYYECVDENRPIPDLISFAHVHTPIANCFVGSRKTVWGYINPCWQMKTRYGYGKAPTEINKIGMTLIDITDDGQICKPYFHLLEIESAKEIKTGG